MRSANGELYENGRRVAGILTEMKLEFAEFVQTPTNMLRTELLEKWKTLQVAIPLVGVAAALLSTAFLLLTGCTGRPGSGCLPNSMYLCFFCVPDRAGVFWGNLWCRSGLFRDLGVPCEGHHSAGG